MSRRGIASEALSVDRPFLRQGDRARRCYNGPAMKAKVRLFARLSELAGTRETEVEVGEGDEVALIPPVSGGA